MPAFGPPLLDAGDAINNRLLLFLPGTEDGGGLTNDLSPRRANGTLVNNPSRVSGALAKAIRLNGSNQYISTAAGQSIPGGFSATARVKLDAAAAYDNSILSSILGVDQTILWTVTAYGTILQFWASTAVSQATATGFPSILGRWADIGVSWAPGRTTRFYVDGNYVGGGSTAGDIQTAITGWNVGRYGVPGIWYFPGDVQLIRAWARVLPDSDFRRLSANPWSGTAQRRRMVVRVAGGTIWNETLSETLAAAEGFVGTLTAPVTLADALTGADAATVALTGAAALADALTGADSHAATLAAAAVLAESATAGEVLSPAMTAGVALSDAGTLADSLSPAVTFGLSLADALTAADALTISAVMAAALAESVAGAESFAAVLLASTSLTDAATLADAYALAIPGTPAPASRTVTWRAHDRLATWAAETRTVTWRAVDRIAKWQE